MSKRAPRHRGCQIRGKKKCTRSGAIRAYMACGDNHECVFLLCCFHWECLQHEKLICPCGKKIITWGEV